MRFRRLGFDAYGPFTGTVLDLSQVPGNGLHLIYGPNEAGKSSALRAIRDLLFGIPQVTQDAHLHAAPTLRLSACIERDGEELAFVRRKKRKDSLVGLDEKPLEEARLSRFLNGLDHASFDRLFGLDHERLQRGGDEMLAGQGDVGEALFDAGAAGRSVHRVKLALLEETEALFKDRAQKPELNRLLAQYAEQKKRAKDAQHSPEKYEAQQERMRETRREAEARRAELSRLRAEKEHLGRLRRVLSSVVERDRKSAERAALGGVPALRGDSSEMREQLQGRIAVADRDAQRLSRQLAELRTKLAGLPEPSPLLRISAETVRSLSDGIKRAEKDLVDLPKLQGQARLLREGMRSDLQRLGRGLDLEAAAARALPVTEQARIQALWREFQGLSPKVESAERELAEARAKVQALASVVDQARGSRRMTRDALLPAELLERFEGELAQAEETVDSFVQRLAAHDRERTELQHQLELLRGQQGVPSEALLSRARAERDECLREAQQLAADPKRKALDLGLPLAALAQAAMRADVVADRLRSEAQRVADVEALQHQLARREREQAALVEAEQRARTALEATNARWRLVAQALSAVELSPREAARLLQEEREAWRDIARHEQELARARAALSAAEGRMAEASSAMQRWRSDWQQAVAPLSLPDGSRPEEVLALLQALSDLGVQRQKLADIERRIEGIQRDVAQFAAQVCEQTDVFAPELSAVSPPEAAARLRDLHSQAMGVAAVRASVEEEMTRAARELAEIEARRTTERQALGELCREAGVPDAASLLELEQRVARARSLDVELSQLDARLVEVCEGEDVTKLVEEARRSDKGAIAARLGDLEDLIPVHEEQSRELERELTRLDMGLQVYGGGEGAEAAQELSATVARLAELSSAWARRRLATVVLDRVVEGYRERHQGPVLARASELFSRLTLGRFSRLQVGLEETRLECVEAADGKGLELEELSRGSRFQLYLALKLASLEQYLKTAPPLPLVLDDVLVEWDDVRARVALEVLAEYSERVQILLFTHLARDAAAASELSDPRIVTHHLQPRAGRRESPALSPI